MHETGFKLILFLLRDESQTQKKTREFFYAFEWHYLFNESPFYLLWVVTSSTLFEQATF